jgi:hypothetical protein
MWNGIMGQEFFDSSTISLSQWCDQSIAYSDLLMTPLSANGDTMKIGYVSCPYSSIGCPHRIQRHSIEEHEIKFGRQHTRDMALQIGVLQTQLTHQQIIIKQLLTMVTKPHQLYVFGGKDKRHNISAQVVRITPNGFEVLPSLSIARAWPAAARTSDAAYISGGNRDSVRINLFERFDFHSKKCSTLPSLPINLDSHGMVICENRFLFVIGGSPNDNDAVSSMYIFDIVKNEWSLGTSMSIGRADPTCTIIGNKIYVCGGSSTNGAYSALATCMYHRFASLVFHFNLLIISTK